MKDWNFGDYLLLILGILILIYIFSPEARKFVCNSSNNIKSKGSKCSNCDTSVEGIIVEGGDCVPIDEAKYDKCVELNRSLKDGDDCVGCGSNPINTSESSYSGKGISVNGQCMPVPDAFAGKLCVPANASVQPSALSYKRILISGEEYKYYKNEGNIINQQATRRDIEINKDEYIQAYVQTIKECPRGQIKV